MENFLQWHFSAIIISAALTFVAESLAFLVLCHISKDV